MQADNNTPEMRGLGYKKVGLHTYGQDSKSYREGIPQCLYF